MFAVSVDTGEKAKPLYDWREMSTYIRRPPYWEGALAGERTLKGMRPLAVLGDNITTDHLSPSNAILPDSASGEYLAKMGLPEEDFNSYATHRGDHLTAQRATFANPTLKNEMAVVDGKVKKGSLARIEPEGKVTRMWEAIETYMERKQPLTFRAGANRLTLGLDGTETYDVIGDRTPRATLTLVIHRKNGERVEVPV